MDIYGSLKAEPAYNQTVLDACETAIAVVIFLTVWHIPGVQNTVANALSRGRLDTARELVPGLRITTSVPPTPAPPKFDAQIDRAPRAS